jgi:hypothetical protein
MEVKCGTSCGRGVASSGKVLFDFNEGPASAIFKERKSSKKGESFNGHV